MIILSKIFPAMAIAVAIVAVGLYFVVRNQKAELAEELRQSVQNAHARDSEVREKEAQAASLTKQVDSLRADLGAERAKSNTLYQQSLQARSEMSSLDEKIDALNEERETRDREIRRLKRDLIGLKSNMPSPSSAGSMDQLEEEIDRLSEEIDRLRRELASSRSRENAPPAANPDGDLSGTSTTRGRQYDGLITDVGPFQAVVAINLGSNDGPRPRPRSRSPGSGLAAPGSAHGASLRRGDGRDGSRDSRTGHAGSRGALGGASGGSEPRSARSRRRSRLELTRVCPLRSCRPCCRR